MFKNGPIQTHVFFFLFNTYLTEQTTTGLSGIQTMIVGVGRRQVGKLTTYHHHHGTSNLMFSNVKNLEAWICNVKSYLSSSGRRSTSWKTKQSKSYIFIASTKPMFIKARRNVCQVHKGCRESQALEINTARVCDETLIWMDQCTFQFFTRGHCMKGKLFHPVKIGK